MNSTLIACLRYRDAHAAIDWLESVLGFQRHAVYTGADQSVQHAELSLGGGMIMLGSVREDSPAAPFSLLPSEAEGRVTSGVYVVVPDCNPVWARAQAAGAKVAMPLQTMEYGGQSFTVCDPEGYVWSVGEYDPWATGQPAQSADGASKGA